MTYKKMAYKESVGLRRGPSTTTGGRNSPVNPMLHIGFTLYPSPHLVLTEHGYTKHYYAGAERLAARQGGGFRRAILGEAPEMADKATILFEQTLHQSPHLATPHEPNLLEEGHLEEVYDRMKTELLDLPEELVIHAEIKVDEFLQSMQNLAASEAEPDVYFYHSDHLGSASWITDKDGNPVQHLQYLPYGEPYINQRVSGYNERFTFTGKERDEETGYGYFGARYMDHELMTMWLSVDPLADKYPSLSPYNYCAWNPIRLIDPDGRAIDSASVSGKIWNMVDPTHECYNAEFASVFSQLANDNTTLFTFEEWDSPEITDGVEIRGRFSMRESVVGQLDKASIGFCWGIDEAYVAPERTLFEEVYHAKQFLDGEFGFGYDSYNKKWRTMGLDMYDEETAHKWADRVSGSSNSWTPNAINYYKYDIGLPDSRRNVTEHYMKYDGCVRSRPPNYDANGVYKDGAYRTMRRPINQ